MEVYNFNDENTSMYLCCLKKLKTNIPTKGIRKNRIPRRDYKNSLKTIHDMIERDMKCLLLVIVRRRQG